ncbi:hypothetical protein HDU87_006714 [Geranomyces variabilis]|uniref:Aminopeptidase n=1 Tax=Geranomyces variabilis TaxID=109894 RepID=A0AAD5XPZ1_9FUNG|nr:hypothetical protein HDU87_006714 [Geranomyces variabilis]
MTRQPAKVDAAIAATAAAPRRPPSLATPLDVYKKKLVSRAVRFGLLLLVCGLVFLRRQTAHDIVVSHHRQSYSGLRNTHVVPRHYVLDLFADVPNAFFVGTARVSISVLRPIDHINFHANGNLTLGESIWLESSGNSPLIQNATSLEKLPNVVSLSFSPRVERGTYILVIPYSGIIGHRTMRGFYRSSLGGTDGSDGAWIAATHFEPVFARDAFPCFDEPALKATFAIAVAVPQPQLSAQQMAVVSNMPVEKTETDVLVVPYGNVPATRFTFATTPLMSTYLVAWAIGPLESLAAVSNGGTGVTAYVQRGRQSEAQLAMNVTVGALDFMEAFTGMPFPLPKLDLWPIPDFGGEAMENLGLMIFEDALMMQTTALLAAHEVAHQWFGDIVTMAWWDDIWLNEGFAEYFQHLILAHLPISTSNPAARFFALEHLPAFQADATSFSRPVASGDARAPISALFDDISYSKGAVVLDMLRSALDHASNAFTDGLRLYLRRHAYGTAITADVFSAIDDALKQAGHAPVASRMMHAWVARRGHPVLRVEDVSDQDDGDDDRQLRISQCGFALWRDGNEGCDAEPSWIVPFSYMLVTGGGGGGDDEHEGRGVSRHYRGAMHGHTWSGPIAAAPGSVAILNTGRTGLFRTLYTVTGYARIAHLLSSYPHQFQPVDRAGLVSDALAMLLAGQAAEESVLPLLGFLWTECNWAVWAAATVGLRGVLDAVHPDEGLVTRWRAAAGALAADVAGGVGWRADGSEDDADREAKSLMRRMVLDFAAPVVLSDAHPVVVHALRFYDAVIAHRGGNDGEDGDDQLPPPELMHLVYATAIARRADAFDALLTAYMKTDQDRSPLPGDVLAGLASTPRAAEQARLWQAVSSSSASSPSRQRQTFIAMSRHPDACLTLLTRTTLREYALGVRVVEEAVEAAVAACVHDEVLKVVREVVLEGCDDGGRGAAWKCEARVLAMRKGLERRTAAHRFLQTARARGATTARA